MNETIDCALSPPAANGSTAQVTSTLKTINVLRER